MARIRQMRIGDMRANCRGKNIHTKHREKIVHHPFPRGISGRIGYFFSPALIECHVPDGGIGGGGEGSGKGAGHCEIVVVVVVVVVVAMAFRECSVDEIPSRATRAGIGMGGMEPALTTERVRVVGRCRRRCRRIGMAMGGYCRRRRVWNWEMIQYSVGGWRYTVRGIIIIFFPFLLRARGREGAKGGGGGFPG
jgi:hypothetical protein